MRRVIKREGTVSRETVGEPEDAAPLAQRKKEYADASSTGDVGEPVEVTWGEELVSPKSFHTCKNGPYTTTTTIRPGETRIQAMDRAYRELAEFAEAQRKKKLASFISAMKDG